MAKSKSKAKSKGKSSVQKAKLSPERYMKEKARKLPLGKCYMNPDWKESGYAQVVVTRIRPDGNIVMGYFLVDTFCLGVKDVIYKTDMSPIELGEFLERIASRSEYEEVTYNEAHNMVYGALSFAEDAGIAPCKEFDIAQYILEEDTEDIPLIEYEYGKDGKYLLVIGPSGKEKVYFNTLRERLGDRFNFITPIDGAWNGPDEDDDFEDGDGYEEDPFSKFDINKMMEGYEKMRAESARHTNVEYSYEYPEYPDKLTVKHQFIADAFRSDDNNYFMPEETVKRILSLPSDEVVDDIRNIVLYETGRTYKAINDGTEIESQGSPVMHSVLFITELKNEKALDIVMEILHQNGEYQDFHLGDISPDLMPPALYVVAKDNIQAVKDYLYMPGMESYVKQNAVDMLTMIVFNQPERRGEIIELFRELLTDMTDKLPRKEIWDAEFAGFVMSNLVDMEAKELIPEIKALYATDCVDKNICGDVDSVVKDIHSPRYPVEKSKYEVPDIYKQYQWIKNFEPKA